MNPLGTDGTVLAEVRDLRRYLLLVEAEMVARGVVETDGPPVTVKTTRCDSVDDWYTGRKSGEPLEVSSEEKKQAEEFFEFSSQRGPVHITKSAFISPRPGGREDTSRHARQEYLMDGESMADYVRQNLQWLTVPGMVATGLINRKWYKDHNKQFMIDHLPRLPIELNAKEHEETLPEYKWLYDWSDGKFRMREAYRELWGKQ
jgi:hypothetical protein